MAQVINFRKDALDCLTLQTKQYDVADSKTNGLRLMVNPGGTKTFILYRKVKGKPQRVKIGRYPELSVEQARKEAGRLNSIITLGGNPHEERLAARLEITFSEMFDRYYNDYALKHTKRPDDNRKMVEFHIFPVFGKQKISAITADKVRALHRCIGEKRGEASANRVMHLVSAVFNFGLKNGYFIGINPCLGLKKFKILSRDRFLSKDELIRFFEAVKLEKPVFQDYFMLSLYTGGRKSNVLSMRWADIDLKLKRWRIPESQTKNQDINVIPLSAPALALLTYRKKENEKLDKPSPYVLTGKGSGAFLKDPKRAFSRIKVRMQIDDIRIHDLRRTLGSYMAISGASLPIIGKALNHKSRDATAIYVRLSDDPVLDAMNKATDLMHPVTLNQKISALRQAAD